MATNDVCRKEQIDILNREPFIQMIYDFIETYRRNKQGGSFGVYGDWGTGKSFILNKVERQLSKDDFKGKYIVIKYNAWLYDYYDEPLVALFASIRDDLAKNGWIDKDKDFINKKLKSVLYYLGKLVALSNVGDASVAKMVNGMLGGIEKVAKDMDVENKNVYIDKNSSLKLALTEFQNLLKQIADERVMVFMVDELDRCLPQYQIKVLERMHHLLNDMNTICIYAISEKQLQYTVKSIFGDNVDFYGYMKKFIDYYIVLKNAEVNAKVLERHNDVWGEFKLMKGDLDNEIIAKLIQVMLSGLNVRIQEKIWEKQKILHAIVFSKNGKQSILVLGCEIMILAMLERQGRYSADSIKLSNRINGEIEIGTFISDFLRNNESKLLRNMEQNLVKLFTDYVRKENEHIVSHCYSENSSFKLPVISCSGSVELQILLIWSSVIESDWVRWTNVSDSIKILREPMKKFFFMAKMMQDEILEQ